jgi:hypothetical protein
MNSVYRLVAVLVLAVVCSAPVARGGLVAFYTFEGNANDISGNGRNGTVFGATLTSAGYEGQAYDFNGTGNYISIPVNLNPAAMPRLTMGAWVNTDAANAIRAIISHDNAGFDRNLNIDFRDTGAFRYSAFTGQGVVSAGPNPAPIGQWVFVAARYDSVAGTVVLDVDGARVQVAATPGGGFNTARIGSNPGFVEFWDGRIDNVFIYDEILSNQRIDEIRRNGASAIVGVPEPSTLAAVAVGAALVVARRGRRRSSRPA